MSQIEGRRIWLVKAGEPLPIEDSPRLLRTGVLAERLVEAGWDVTWWTPTFDHRRKVQRPEPPGPVQVGQRYVIRLLESSDYRRNVSIDRVRSLRRSASAFAQDSAALPRPDVVLASYPFPELCLASEAYATAHGIPFVLDMRDPFPDNLASVLPAYLRPSVWPSIVYYRGRLRHLLSRATGVTGMSNEMLSWALTYARRSERGPMDQLFEIGADPLNPPPVVDVPDRFSSERPLVCLFICSGGESIDGATVLEAFRILETRDERRIRCFFTGEGPRHAEWRRDGKDPTGVEFTGFVTTRMEELLRQSHVGLISMAGGLSRFWLGNKFFEYLSGSMAMVNNSEGDAVGLIEKFGLGRTIPRHDPVALADALQQLASSPEKVRAAMDNAARTFNAHFDRERIYQGFVSYLSDVAEQGRHS